MPLSGVVLKLRLCALQPTNLSSRYVVTILTSFIYKQKSVQIIKLFCPHRARNLAICAPASRLPTAQPRYMRPYIFLLPEIGLWTPPNGIVENRLKGYLTGLQFFPVPSLESTMLRTLKRGTPCVDTTSSTWRPRCNRCAGRVDNQKTEVISHRIGQWNCQSRLWGRGASQPERQLAS